MPQELSAKEHSLFRNVMRCYEDKQYKKGLKAAEQILRRSPNHGDTLAMKALIINSQGKSDQALALAKVALKCDMKSHVCWHVYGLLYRSAKNFEEAIKAYKFALKIEPESLQIQRDLAMLQIQMRNYQGYVVSRTAMLQSRPCVRANWTALAVAHHLNGDLAEAERVLTSYEDTLKTPPSKTDIENSEAVLYKNTLIAEQGNLQKALEHLESVKESNLDRLSILELHATYLAKLGRKEEAVKAYRVLLDRNSEYKTYYKSLTQAMGIDPSNHKAQKAVYDEYAQKYPRCDAARRLPLDFLEGEDFKEAADIYVNRMLNKGVPSTFANLKNLYSDNFKKETLADLVQKYLEKNRGLTDNLKVLGQDKLRCISAAYYFLAQHFNYHLSRDLDRAINYIQKAIHIDPKNVDFHMTMARIWKHYGNRQKASEIMEQSRNLDIRDRYINTKTAKYQLRNNQTENAIKTMAVFTRAETVGGPLADLHDMQCIWYLTEDGQSNVRQGKIGLALKRFTAIQNIFDVWHEDQFDFHSFSFRKGHIRAYIDMIRWEDKLREHPFYTRAAISAINVYINLHDQSSKTSMNHNDVDKNDTAENKKAAKRAFKEQLRAERENATKKSAPNKLKNGDREDGKKEDDDPNGVRLAATTEPLNDALKFLQPLIQLNPNSIDTQVIGFEVYIRRKKYLLALKCLLKAIDLHEDHPKVHEQIIRFKQTFDANNGSLSPTLVEVLQSEFKFLSISTNLTEYNENYLQKYKSSPREVMSALIVRRLLDSEISSEADIDFKHILTLPNITLDEASEAFELLKLWNSNELDSYRLEAASKWPNATTFELRS